MNKRHQPIQITLSLILASLGIIGFNTATVAEEQIEPEISTEEQLQAENQIIYVNPTTGDDQLGRGDEQSPFKTITQALMIAEPESVIMLASGTYSSETGENFPLLIKTDVTIKGHATSKGRDIIIQGNGVYISPTAAGQNVTIVATKNAGGLIGVTVTNPDRRGHGLWIESAAPVITDNTFTRNGNSGISVNGSSAPKIIDNYFYNNGGNGLLVYGTSQCEVRDNVFEKSGFGVSLIEETNTLLVNNQMTNNRVGVILEAPAQATLRNNVIEQSTESGLVALAQSRVDLGTMDEPGGNIFRANRNLDIKNLGSEMMLAIGNQIAGRSEGRIDFSSNARAENLPTRRTPSTLDDLNSVPTPPSPPTTANNNQSQVIEIPVIPPASSSNPQTLPDPPEVPNSSNSEAREIVVTPYSDNTNNQTSNSQTYRVLVATENSQQVAQVQSLYPNAFPIAHNGQSMLQLGVFSDWENVRAILENINNLGLSVTIVD